MKEHCDLCWFKDGKHGLVLQHCSTCGIAVHDACYGMDDLRQCWACAAVGTTVKCRDGKGGHKVFRMTERPTECALCGFQDTQNLLPMHALYDASGPSGRQLMLPPNQYLPARPAWVHTLCGFVVGGASHIQGTVYGATWDGNYEVDEPSADTPVEEEDDDWSINSQLQEPDQPSDFHHFVMEHKHAQCVQNRITTREQLHCEICYDQDAYRLCVQCAANEPTAELPAYTRCHADSKPCPRAFHVGCALYGKQQWPSHRRVLFFPGGATHYADCVRCLYCPKHARDLPSRKTLCFPTRPSRRERKACSVEVKRKERKRWLCDVCRVRQFATLPEAEAHEAVCQGASQPDAGRGPRSVTGQPVTQLSAKKSNRSPKSSRSPTTKAPSDVKAAKSPNRRLEAYSDSEEEKTFDEEPAEIAPYPAPSPTIANQSTRTASPTIAKSTRTASPMIANNAGLAASKPAAGPRGAAAAPAPAPIPHSGTAPSGGLGSRGVESEQFPTASNADARLPTASKADARVVTATTSVASQASERPPPASGSVAGVVKNAATTLGATNKAQRIRRKRNISEHKSGEGNNPERSATDLEPKAPGEERRTAKKRSSISEHKEGETNKEKHEELYRALSRQVYHGVLSGRSAREMLAEVGAEWKDKAPFVWTGLRARLYDKFVCQESKPIDWTVLMTSKGKLGPWSRPSIVVPESEESS